MDLVFIPTHCKLKEPLRKLNLEVDGSYIYCNESEKVQRIFSLNVKHFQNKEIC